MCRVDRYECSELLSEKTRVARKQHTCQECRRIIEAGEKYLYEVTLFDGEVAPNKTCSHCQIARSWLADECGGWVYTEVAGDIREHAEDGYGPEALREMSRAIFRKWRSTDGTLMPIPAIGASGKP